MVLKILGGIVIAVLILLGVAALQPEDFSLSRTISIKGDPSVIFPHVNDFHRWTDWSPWAKLDPEMKVSYEGPAAGEGSTYSWVGNSAVGEGKMTLLKSQPFQLVRIQLEFLKPFAATNMTDFTFAPLGRETTVTWTMTGKNNLLAKAFSLFVSMEKMVGPDFEKGLAQLKATVEAGG